MFAQDYSEEGEVVIQFCLIIKHPPKKAKPVPDADRVGYVAGKWAATGREVSGRALAGCTRVRRWPPPTVRRRPASNTSGVELGGCSEARSQLTRYAYRAQSGVKTSCVRVTISVGTGGIETPFRCGYIVIFGLDAKRVGLGGTHVAEEGARRKGDARSMSAALRGGLV